jgi:hypothetical protein
MPPKSSPMKKSSSVRKSSPGPSAAKKTSRVKRMISSITPAQKKKIMAAAALLAGGAATLGAFKVGSNYGKGKYNDKITKIMSSKVGSGASRLYNKLPSLRKKEPTAAPRPFWFSDNAASK